MPNKPVQGGVYRHFKGSEYVVLAIAEHTETGEVMVVYMPIQMGKVWARPLLNWMQKAPSGEPRFKLITAPPSAIQSEVLGGDRDV